MLFFRLYVENATCYAQTDIQIHVESYGGPYLTQLAGQISIPLSTNIDLEYQELYSISGGVPYGQSEFMIFAQKSAYVNSTYVDNAYFKLDDNKFYAKKAGVYKIEACLYVGWNVAERFDILVYAGISTGDMSLSITPTNTTMSATQTMKINAQLKVPTGYSKTLSWSVSGSPYAKISSSGALTVSSKLTTPTQLYLSATLKSYIAISANCYVTVYPKPAIAVINTKNATLTYDVTKAAPTLQIIPSFTPTNAAQDFICKSSNTKVVTVDADGTIVAVGKRAGNGDLYAS